jgi:dihydroorotase
MISIERRQLITGIGAVFATATMGPVARAAMGPDDKFDLVIKGGEVVDPSQGLRGKRDIGMRYEGSRRSRPTSPPPARSGS